jgi:hypothetical protein
MILGSFHPDELIGSDVTNRTVQGQLLSAARAAMFMEGRRRQLGPVLIGGLSGNRGQRRGALLACWHADDLSGSLISCYLRVG